MDESEVLMTGLGSSQCVVRNLDTMESWDLSSPGAVDAVAPSASSPSLHAVPSDTSLASGDRPRTAAKPWENWWREKRRKDAELWNAAEMGDVDAMTQIIASVMSPPSLAEIDRPPYDVNSRSLNGWTALHLAAHAGHSACIDLIMEVVQDPNPTSDQGRTALHLAAMQGHMECVRSLVGRWRATLDCQDAFGATPLHLASSGGHGRVVRLLLSHGSDYRIKNNSGLTARQEALNINTRECFNDVINRDSSAAWDQDTSYGRTPFRRSVLLHNARSDVVRKLLSSAQQSFHSQQPVSKDDTVGGPRRLHSPDSPRHATAGGRMFHYLGRLDSGMSRTDFAPSEPVNGIDEMIGPNLFDIGPLLGKGSFGSVYKVTHKSTGVCYAMKILEKRKIIGRSLVRYALTERNILSYIRHPHIVELAGAFQTSDHLVLLLEYCSRGNLQQLISRHKRLKQSLAKLYTAEILTALEYLHERNIVFRDLKPDNVVLDDRGHALLTDFGLSKELVSDLYPAPATSFCGSVAYLAPEMLSKRGHGKSVDLYGLGVLLYEMLVGTPPYFSYDREQLFKNIETQKLTFPAHVSPDARDLISQLLDRDPQRRLGAMDTQEVRQHPFFADIDWEGLAAMRKDSSSVAILPPNEMPCGEPSNISILLRGQHGVLGGERKRPFNRVAHPIGKPSQPHRASSVPLSPGRDNFIHGWSFAGRLSKEEVTRLRERPKAAVMRGLTQSTVQSTNNHNTHGWLTSSVMGAQWQQLP
mmetsp:Transcript_20540/g.58677  ORF Transcript_20540/g.58677 Transcript_20540/m.58677 type:complete len:755 (+) Transcript_20540:83-2347(+)